MRLREMLNMAMTATLALTAIAGVPGLASAQGFCGNNCPGSYCNAVGIIDENQTQLRGIWASIETADPQLRSLHSWSLMRLVVRNDCAHPSGNCFGEVGWIKSDCFTDPTSSCPHLGYASWKGPIRHIVIWQSPNGYWSWDIADIAAIGWTHHYMLERDNDTVGWEAYIDGRLWSRSWTGFDAPEQGWAGGEVPNPPSNAMGVSGILNVRFMDPNRIWHYVNGQYGIWEEHPAYHVIPISQQSWQVYGCN